MSALPPPTTSYNNYNLQRHKLRVDIFKKKTVKRVWTKDKSALVPVLLDYKKAVNF